MILPTSFLPNTYYFSIVAKGGAKGICTSELYVKQTYRNRADFFSANGRISFTIPVHKIGYPSPKVSDVFISEHGNWRDGLWQLLSSAYRSTPYWEYYSDTVMKCVYNPTPRLIDYNQQWLSMLCLLSGTEIPPLLTSQDGLFTESIDPSFLDNLPRPTRYWQVFEQKHGFQPYLSAFDMLLNLGPESRLILCEGGRNA